MQSPARGIRFIHSALSREVADLEQAVHQASDLPSLAGRVAFFARVADAHNRGEEVGLFPAIAERLPGTDSVYLDEHAEEKAMLADLQRAVEAGDTATAHRVVSAIREHLHGHIARENDVLVPLIEATFTPAEQGAHIGRMMSVFTPQDMAEIVPWMVTSLDPADRLAWLGTMRATAPPERFAGLLGMLRQRLSDEVRREMAADVPELA